MNSDFKDLLHLFNANQVKYLVIGGVAFIFHAEPRYTKDLDIWVQADNENAAKVYRALAEFGAPIAQLSPEDFAQEGYFYTMGVAPTRIDILMSVDGLSFDDAWQKRVEAEVSDTKIVFISKEDLIASKLASGRDQDLRDAKTLSLSVKPPSEFQQAKPVREQPSRKQKSPS